MLNLTHNKNESKFKKKKIMRHERERDVLGLGRDGGGTMRRDLTPQNRALKNG